MQHDLTAAGTPRPPGAPAVERDPAVDAARVGCVIAVVCIHILMVTLTADPATGEIRSVLVPTQQPWYWWATWIFQICLLYTSPSPRD